MEPNDIISQAIETNLSFTNQGNFSAQGQIGDNPDLENPAEDIDIYKFQLNAGDRVNINVDEIDPALIPGLALLDSDGNAIALNDVEFEFDSDSDPDNPFEPPTITADPSIDFTVGETGDYFVDVSSPFSDSLTTGEYNIDITTSKNEDVIFGTENNDSLPGTSGDDTIIGGAGNDEIFASEGENTLFGNAGDDLINGGSEADTIFAGEGNDIVQAAEGDNNVFGESGDDTIYTGSGDDVIDGGSGNDIIFAGEGNNEIYADAFSEFGILEFGDDTIYTGSGDDFIDSGSGNDIIVLGGGFDLVILAPDEGTDTINNFQLDQTSFAFLGDIEELSFNDGASGAEISFDDRILAVVSNVSASTITDNIDTVFAEMIEL